MQRLGRYAASLTAFALLLTVAGCSSKLSESQNDSKPARPSTELYILAAASLNNALQELAPKYESSHPGQKLVISYGGSGTLQQQIEQGAPADLFISAAAKQMNELLAKGLIDANLHANLLTNKLVLIIPKNSPSQVSSFEDVKNPSVNRIVMGQPESVPAGTYAKQSLTNLGLWEDVQSKLVYAKDVRQVLTYVETGNVDAGIVYQTDAKSSDKVQIAATADEKSHSPIVYPIGIVKNSKHPKEAQELYNWLSGPEAESVFAKYGFDKAVKK